MPTIEERKEARAIFVIALAALLLRSASAWLTLDIPGDGVSRALGAYNWSFRPELIRSGVWLPGLTYLTGALCMLFPSPLIAPRLLNVVLGTANVLLLYAVARPIFGHSAALVSATILALLPLHIGLSASSLSEPAFLFAMLAALWSAFGAVDRHAPRSRLRLGLLVASGVLAEMLRYEAWLMLPIVVAYVAWRRRSPRAAIGLAAAFLCFPIFWSYGNFVNGGDPFVGFTTIDVDLVNRTPPLAAAGVLFGRISQQIGPVGTAILFLAALDVCVGVGRRTATPERVFVLVLLVIATLIPYAMALRNGWNLLSRYVIFSIVLALPMAIECTWNYVREWRARVALAAACLLSLGLTYAHQQPQVYVTRHLPAALVEFAEWYRQSDYRTDALLFTRINWYPDYLTLYRPELIGRTMIASNYKTDEQIEYFLRARQPALLVTQPGDLSMRDRIEQQLGRTIELREKVRTFGESGDLEVFDIRPAH